MKLTRIAAGNTYIEYDVTQGAKVTFTGTGTVSYTTNEGYQINNGTAVWSTFVSGSRVALDRVSVRAICTTGSCTLELDDQTIADGFWLSGGVEFFPSCKMLMLHKETSGSKMLEEVTGTSITVGASMKRVGNYTEITGRSSAAQIPELFGSTIEANTVSAILVFGVQMPINTASGLSVVGGYDANNHIHMLQSTVAGGGGIGADINIPHPDGVNTNHNAPTQLATVNVPYGFAIAVDPGNPNGLVTFYKTNGTDYATETVAGTGLTTVPQFNSVKFSCGGSGGKLGVYMTAIFQFASGNIPTDIELALKYMTTQALAGRPAIYPGWIGRI